MEASLIDDAAERQPPGILVDQQLNAVCGQVRDPAMQRVEQFAARVDIGGTVALQPAAAQKLIETFQPTQAGWIENRNECRVDRFTHGRPPAERVRPTSNAPNTHASRRENIEANRAVVDLDDVHAFRSTTAARSQSHAPIKFIAMSATALKQRAVMDDRFTGIDKYVRTSGHATWLWNSEMAQKLTQRLRRRNEER
jgi:hypothetical protein